MKREKLTQRAYLFAQTVLVMVIVGLALADSSRAAGDVERPTPHELAAIAATEGPRLWYHEAEFARDPLLRAEPHQVVILHLEPADRGGKPIRHTIPYLFPETATFNFCVPKDDPHIRSLRLVREGSQGVVVDVPRGAPCKTRTIAAGLYQLHVDHDGTDISAEGKKVFVHVPRFKGNLQAGSGLGRFPTCDNVNPDNNPQYAFTTPNGMFVVPGSDGKVRTQSTPDDALGGWNICPDGSGNYTIFQPTFGPPNFFFSSGPPNTDTSLYAVEEDALPAPPTAFKLTDLGNGQFTLMASFNGTLYPIVVGSDGALHWVTSGNPTAFTTVLKFYNLAATTMLPLQPGEVALFQGCNYTVPGDGTWVFATSIADFSVFRAFGGVSLDNTIASVKLGPQTIATLYANANYGGTAQLIGADTPCLSGTPLGINTASSLKITPARQFVAATDACQNCNLSGVDLSNLDLSGGQFQDSTFTGANLTNTSFQAASLDNANLNGSTTTPP